MFTNEQITRIADRIGMTVTHALRGDNSITLITRDVYTRMGRLNELMEAFGALDIETSCNGLGNLLYEIYLPTNE